MEVENMDKVSPQIHAQISDNPNDSIKQNKSNKSSCFRRTTNNPSENGAVDEEIKKKKRNKVKFPKSGDPIFTNPEIFMTPEEILLNHGYQSELHEIESEDGYITTLLRIPYGKGETAQNCRNPQAPRPPVLFAHGIATNGISWVLNKEENVLAYQLVDKGFEVYLYNARGTQPSQKHVKLSPTSRKYWKHSWHEMSHDIAGVVSYVLKTSGQEQLFYVGHSMGCAILFAATSMHSELASKIKLMIAYAPAVYIGHATSPMVSTASKLLPMSCLSAVYHGEVYSKPTIKIMKKWAPWIWIFKNRNVRDSTWWMWKGCNLVNGINDEQIYWPMMPVMAGQLPAAFSVRTYDHFLQNHKSGEFRRYDFGRRKNLKEYGQVEPPTYSFENVTFPVALFYGDNDASVNVRGVMRLSQELPNVVATHRVDWKDFAHFDFVISKNAHELVNVHVLKLISDHM